MIVSRYTGIGGGNIVINNLCSELQKLDYKIGIGAFTFDKEPPSGITKVKLKRIGRLENNLSKFNFDIIHCHQAHMNYYSLFSKHPFLYHYHGAATRQQRFNLKLSFLLCKKHISKVIAVSNEGLDQFTKLCGVTNSLVVYNGVDTNLFNPNLEKKFRKGSPQLLSVGILYTHKRVNKIIESMSEIVKMYPDVHLQIVGNGEEFNDLQKLIENYKLEKHVKLLGKVSFDELRYRYTSCDILVSASTFELLPVSVMEAMSCGKPVLLSNLDAHKEIIYNSKAGLIDSFDNPLQVSRKIQEIFEKRSEYGLNARNFAEKHNSSIMSKKIAEIYDNYNSMN